MTQEQIQKIVLRIIADRRWKNGYLMFLVEEALKGNIAWHYTDLSAKEVKKYL